MTNTCRKTMAKTDQDKNDGKCRKCWIKLEDVGKCQNMLENVYFYPHATNRCPHRPQSFHIGKNISVSFQ